MRCIDLYRISLGGIRIYIGSIYMTGKLPLHIFKELVRLLVIVHFPHTHT